MLVLQIIFIQCFRLNVHFQDVTLNQIQRDGIDLSTWVGVRADPNIVFPGEPDLSRLVWTIDASVSGISKMPPIGYANR